MKSRLQLTFLIGVTAFVTSVAQAGEYCATDAGKCVVDSCPPGGCLSFGYDTDYIFYGVRRARDVVWTDVNYTFDKMPFPVTVGAYHLTSLNSSNTHGDESRIYAKVKLNEFYGIRTSAGYIHYFYPTQRGPGGPTGDSLSEVWMKIEKEIMGVNVFYRRAYDKQSPAALAGGFTNNNTDRGAWVHMLGVEKCLELTDGVGLNLGAGVLYTDNYWPADTTAFVDGNRDRQSSTGWNSYYLRAAFPIALGCRATVTPYIGYNGAPDSWIADGVQAFGGSGTDIFHGGVSLSVKF